MRCSVIGAGAMGRAIARRLALAGETVLLADRDTGKAWRAAAGVSTDPAPGIVLPADLADALHGDVELTVLALAHRDCLELAMADDRPLAGKVIVDVVNSLEGPEFGMGPSGVSSAAERLASAAPESIVVKAFNTASAPVLYEGELDGIPVDVFVASDDEEAKLAVIELVNRSGLRGFDMGRLRNARGLESMAALTHELRDRLGLTVRAGFTFLPRW